MTKSTQRTHATEGTQAHNDIANIKMNIKYYTETQGMDRDQAKKLVDGFIKQGVTLKTNEEINRAIAAEKKRQAQLAARKEKERQEQEAKEKFWADQAAKAEEERIIKEEEAMWSKVKPEPKIARQGKGGMKVIRDGIEYPTLVAAMVSTGKYDTVETKLRSSHWNRINKGIKSNDSFNYDGDVYSLIK